MDLIKVVNEAFATKKEFPAFKSGVSEGRLSFSVCISCFFRVH